VCCFININPFKTVRVLSQMLGLNQSFPNPIHPVVPEKAPIKAHPKGTSFGARGERFGYSK
ncbi:MAG: hypothetical protein AB2669_12770, partial [Candidatus Thiodiazotropha endolucinida]